MPDLLAVPNVSTAGDEEALGRLAEAFGRSARVLDFHTDSDHGRSVFTIAGEAGGLAESLLAGAAEAAEAIDMSDYDGAHPAIGALDVCPLVWLREEDHAAARTEAVAIAGQIGGLGIPVFLYGELAREPGHTERAYFRNGGLTELWLRMQGGELRPDFGPPLPHPARRRHPGHGAPAARRVQRRARGRRPRRRPRRRRRTARGRGGLPGVRAMGLMLSSGRAQVSTNVHDPLTTTLATVVEDIRRLAAPLGARPVEAELVGLIPAGALVDYPADVPIRGFDPAQHVIERRLAAPTD